MIKQNGSGSLTTEQSQFYEEQGYLIIPQLLSEKDLASAREAMTQKVSMIADELFADGLITDKLEDRPFPNRLAELFQDLSAENFLKYGRSSRPHPWLLHLDEQSENFGPGRIVNWRRTIR